MAYFLLYKYDRKEDQKVRKLQFSREPEAVMLGQRAQKAELLETG